MAQIVYVLKTMEFLITSKSSRTNVCKRRIAFCYQMIANTPAQLIFKGGIMTIQDH